MRLKILTKFKQNLPLFPYSFVTWISHFATLLISSAIILFVLNHNYKQTTINTISSLNTELSNYVEKTSTQIQDMIKYYGYYTFYSPSVAKLRKAKNLSNFEVISGIRELNTFVSTSTYVHSVYVYNAEAQYIYSTRESGSNDVTSFPDKNAVEIFLKGVQQNTFDSIYRPLYLKNENKSKNVYSFILHESQNGIDYDNALMINLFEDEYNNSFFGTHSEKEAILVKDTGQIIIDSNIPSHEFSTLAPSILKGILESSEENGYIIDHSQKNKIFYLYSYMPESGRYFIRYLKYSEFLDNLSSIRTLSILVLSIILLSGFIISLIMLNRMYLPLKKIILSLSDNDSKKTLDNDSILKNLDFWVQDRAQDKQEYISVVKQEFLKQLLTFPVSPINNMEENFNHYEIDLIADLPIHLFILKDITPIEGVTHIKKTLPSTHIEGVAINGFTVFFVQLDSYAKVDAICKNLLSMGPDFCAYSYPIYNYNEFKRSYDRIEELYLLRVFYPESPFLTEDTLNSKSKKNIYPDQQEIKIVQTLRNGKHEEAIKQYHDWMDIIINYRYNIIVFAFKRLYLTLQSLHQLILTSSDNPFLSAEVDFIQNKLETIDNIEEINHIFYQLFSQITDKVLLDRNIKNEKLVKEIKLIVKSQFTDSILSPQTISDVLGLSVTYLGKLFRSIEKCSISDYINKIRIIQAKELLLKSNLTVKEISQKVGFDNTSYFYTLFKNHCGMSPTVFRQSK